MTPQQRALAVAAATAIAIPAEGLRRTYYYDPPGILTVCYGHTQSVDKSRIYTEAECRALLDQDMTEAVDTAARCAPGAPWQVVAAFGDAIYNIGPRIACDRATSTAARLLAARRFEEACRQLPRWNKARVAGVLVPLGGLTKRRAKEETLCLSAYAQASPVASLGWPDDRRDVGPRGGAGAAGAGSGCRRGCGAVPRAGGMAGHAFHARA
jgi:GH24 family phage-related lysozyme (muramidase)